MQKKETCPTCENQKEGELCPECAQEEAEERLASNDGSVYEFVDSEGSQCG